MRSALVALTAACGLLVFACSDSSTTGSSSGGGSDAGDGGATDSGSTKDAGDPGNVGPAVNNCNDFVDRTDPGAARVIRWDITVGSRPERCMKIKVGQKVTFSSDGAGAAGDFDTHPPIEDGGDKPSPIPTFDRDTGEVTFPNAGTFGFACGEHPTMVGAIRVVE